MGVGYQEPSVARTGIPFVSGNSDVLVLFSSMAFFGVR
jgi:hypothetical protein